MTSSNGTQGNGLDGQHVPIAGSEARTKRVRRGAIVLAVVVLVGAGAVFAAMMLTASPSSSAPGQSPTMSGDMPGMNHGAGQMPASTPSSTGSGDMPRMELVSADMPGMSQDVGHPSTPTPTMSGDMPGMDHGPSDKPAGSPTPTMSGDMPGMDHGEGHGSTPWPSASPDVPATDHGDGHGSSPSPTMAKDMPGMDHGSAEMPGSSSEHADAAAVVTDRPLAPVLGTFGGASSAVMLSAVFLRRKDRIRSQAKAAARAARRTQK